MISRQEYAYGIGDGIVHNGVVFKNKLRNEGYNK